MTVEQFSNLKNQIQEQLNRKLKLSQDVRCASYPVVMVTKNQSFKLKGGMGNQLELLKEVISFADRVKGTVSHSPTEDTRGRVGYYDYTLIQVEYQEVASGITELMVKDKVKQALRGIMKLGNYRYIECKLMKLYQEGKLSWEDLVSAHQSDCSI